MIVRGVEKSRIDTSQGALVLEYVGGNNTVLIKIIQRGIGYKDHFPEHIPKHQHGSIDQPFAFYLEESLVRSHSRAFPAGQNNTCHRTYAFPVNSFPLILRSMIVGVCTLDIQPVLRFLQRCNRSSCSAILQMFSF